MIKPKGFAAGTADFYSKRVSTRLHLKHDYDPFMWAQRLDHGSFGPYNEMYAEVREINQGGGAKLKKEDCCDNGPE